MVMVVIVVVVVVVVATRQYDLEVLSAHQWLQS
jgi:hypothetical protein